MAHVHANATLTPSKSEIVAAWLPHQEWFRDSIGPAGVLANFDADIDRAGEFRFDDPDGEVGLETLLLRCDGRTLVVPVSYRGAEPPDGVAVIGTLEHSVLGTRWVSDGTTDPVFVQALLQAAFSGPAQAKLEAEDADGNVSTREPTAVLVREGEAGPVPTVTAVTSRIEGRTSVIDVETDAGPVMVTIHRVLGTPWTPGDVRLVLDGDQPFASVARG